jgi:hypothetical protein
MANGFTLHEHCQIFIFMVPMRFPMGIWKDIKKIGRFETSNAHKRYYVFLETPPLHVGRATLGNVLS